jgi:hypothetical protein
MRLFKFNMMVLALIFSLLIEGISTGVYYWLGSSFGPGTLADKLCDLDLFVHRPAAKLTQIFYPASLWPGIGAHILFYIFALCECWLLTLAVIWILRHFYQRLDNKSRAG